MDRYRQANSRPLGSVDLRGDEFRVSIIKTINPVFEDALGLGSRAISLAHGGTGEAVTVLSGLVGALRVIIEAVFDTRAVGLVVLPELVVGLGVGSEIADVLSVGVVNENAAAELSCSWHSSAVANDRTRVVSWDVS